MSLMLELSGGAAVRLEPMLDCVLSFAFLAKVSRLKLHRYFSCACHRVPPEFACVLRLASPCTEGTCAHGKTCASFCRRQRTAARLCHHSGTAHPRLLSWKIEAASYA